MALISARTILTSLSLFHITLGFFFLTNPITIADQALVYIIGEAMGLPHSRSFENQSPALAFLAVILMTVGITDLVSLSLPDEICLVHHWGTQAPIRLFIAMLSLFYSFAFGASSPLYSPTSRDTFPHHPSARAQNPGYAAATWGGDGLKNRVFFTFMFVEMISWFWVWVTLREERHAMVQRKANRRRGSTGYGTGY